jgi:hypothetical protein
VARGVGDVCLVNFPRSSYVCTPPHMPDRARDGPARASNSCCSGVAVRCHLSISANDHSASHHVLTTSLALSLQHTFSPRSITSVTFPFILLVTSSTSRVFASAPFMQAMPRYKAKLCFKPFLVSALSTSLVHQARACRATYLLVHRLPP